MNPTQSSTPVSADHSIVRRATSGDIVYRAFTDAHGTHRVPVELIG